MRASCFKRILDNYAGLLQEWIVSRLNQNLQSEIRGRIIGCQTQMNTFDFFFGLNLGERLFSHTDNLSKILQKTKISAVSGQRVASLTKEVLQKMRADAHFQSFYESVLLKSKKHPSILEPALPRRTRAPSRFEIGGNGEPSYPATPQDRYRRIYFEAIDLMVNAIDQRFKQPSFVAYAKMESLLVNALNSQDYSTELQFIETNYSDDVNVKTLEVQLEIFKVLVKDEELNCCDDILVYIKKLPEPGKSMINEIITICKLLLVNPATSAAGERSSSAARRLKRGSVRQ